MFFISAPISSSQKNEIQCDCSDPWLAKTDFKQKLVNFKQQ